MSRFRKKAKLKSGNVLSESKRGGKKTNKQKKPIQQTKNTKQKKTREYSVPLTCEKRLNCS